MSELITCAHDPYGNEKLTIHNSKSFSGCPQLELTLDQEWVNLSWHQTRDLVEDLTEWLMTSAASKEN